MKTLKIWDKDSVILSGGEPVDFLFSQDSPEPQSKDLARPSANLKKRHEMLLHMERDPLTARTGRANIPRGKTLLRQYARLSSFQARSFDFGSGSVSGKTRSPGSPSLRMTELLLEVMTNGGTP